MFIHTHTHTHTHVHTHSHTHTHTHTHSHVHTHSHTHTHREWLREAQEHCTQKFETFLVGTKKDLVVSESVDLEPN